jgi:hypothetical protein
MQVKSYIARASEDNNFYHYSMDIIICMTIFPYIALDNMLFKALIISVDTNRVSGCVYGMQVSDNWRR